MVLFNYSTKELTAKIVYYGAGLCGKTTNLQHIHEQVPIKNKGKMLSLATEADRTLFFDFLPIELGTIKGMKTRVQLYTVPGQVFYNATRRMVLKGADCVVFVADSQEAMLDANTDALKNLRENLIANELDPDTIPLVFQYNKRDLPNALSVAELNKALNSRGVPFVEASAKSGVGVEDTLKVATQLVFKVLAAKYGDPGPVKSAVTTTGGTKRPTPPPAPPPAPAPLTDDLLDSLGPGPVSPAAPGLSLDAELDLGPVPSPPARPSAKPVSAPLEDPFGFAPPSATPPPDPFGFEELPSSAGAADPLDALTGSTPIQSPGNPLDDLGFDSPGGAPASLDLDLPGNPPGDPPAPSLDSILDPPSPSVQTGASTAFTADPVSAAAEVNVSAADLRSAPVQISIPVQLKIASGVSEILIPIKLQLKINIRS